MSFLQHACEIEKTKLSNLNCQMRKPKPKKVSDHSGTEAFSATLHFFLSTNSSVIYILKVSAFSLVDFLFRIPVFWTVVIRRTLKNLFCGKGHVPLGR